MARCGLGVIFAVLLPSSVFSALTCVSISNIVDSDYCQTSCTHPDTPFCPSTLCSCSEEGQPTTTTVTLVCQGHLQNSAYDDEWCTANCNHQPPFCPSALCTCAATLETIQTDALTCVSLREPATDAWCTDNCNKNFCPTDFCACTDATSQTPEPSATPTPTFYGVCDSFSNAWCTQTCQYSSYCPECCSTTFVSVWQQFYSSCETLSDSYCTAICNDYPTLCPSGCCSLDPVQPSTWLNFEASCSDINVEFCDSICNSLPELCPGQCCSSSQLATPLPTPIPAFTYVAVSASVDASCAAYTNELCGQVCSQSGCPSCCYMEETTAVPYYSTCDSVTDNFCEAACSGSTHNLCPAQCCTPNKPEPEPSPSSAPTYYAVCTLFTDEWCTANCNHEPAVCPVCCSSDPLSTTTTYASVCDGITDQWCTLICLMIPEQCSSTCCVVADGSVSPSPSVSALPTTEPTATPEACPSFPAAWCNEVCSSSPENCPACCQDPTGNGQADPMLALQWHANSGCLSYTPAWCSDICNHQPSLCPLNCCNLDGTDQMYYANPQCPTYTDTWCSVSCLFSPSTCSDCCSTAPFTDESTMYYSLCPLATNEWCTSVCSANLFSCPATCCTTSSDASSAVPISWIVQDSCKPVFTDDWCTARCNSGACHGCCMLANSTTIVDYSTQVTLALTLSPSQLNEDQTLSASFKSLVEAAFSEYLLTAGETNALSVKIVHDETTVLADGDPVSAVANLELNVQIATHPALTSGWSNDLTQAGRYVLYRTSETAALVLIESSA